MIGMRKLIALLVAAFGLAAFSLPASAHYVTLQMTAGVPGTLTAKITNTSPSGPYTINSLKMPIGGTGTNVGGVTGVSVFNYSPGGANPAVSVSGGNISIPSGISLAKNQSITLTLTGVTPSPASCSPTSTKWSVKAYEDSNYGGYLYQPAPSGNALTVLLTPACNTVTFNSNGGSAVASQTVPNGGTATAPTAPTRTGYTFAGWYSDAGLTTPFVFATPIIANITLYAKWTPNILTVSFNSNGGSVVASQSVPYNSPATQPADPTKTGYTFAGWFSDAGFTTAFVFSTPITANTTLYAKWSTNSYTVIFDSNGGSLVASQSVPYNTLATQPADPTKTGYTFAGWYSDAGFTTAFSFSTPITATITLYAKWTIINYTVSFNSNGGSTVANQSVPYNTPATAPADPTKALNTFAGWYSDSGLTTAFVFSTPITATTTLYAKWTVNTSSFAPPPTSATSAAVGPNGTVGPFFSMTVNLAPAPATGTQVTLTATGGSTCSSLTGGTTTTNAVGSAIFSALQFTGSAATCTLTAKVTGSNYPDATLTPFAVYASGNLACSTNSDFPTSVQPGFGPLDPEADQAYIVTGWGLRRAGDLGGTTCPVPVNFTLTTGTDPSDSAPIASLVYDKLALPTGGNFKYVIVLDPRPYPADGWPTLRPQVAWNNGGPPDYAAVPPEYVDGLACLSDDNALLGSGVMPPIPNTPYWIGQTNPAYTYAPNKYAKMCIAQVGWTPAVDAQNNPIGIQWWVKVIDQSDGGVKFP